MSEDDRSAVGLGHLSDRPLATVDDEVTHELVATIKHHLRTPLTAVLGHAELAADHDRELPCEIRLSLTILQRAGWRLNDAIEGICELIDATCVGLDAVDMVDVSQLVAREVATFQARAARSDVRLAVAGHEEAVCVADPRRLRRALRALLDNALTHAPDRSTVRVTVASAVAASHGGRLILSENQGAGLRACLQLPADFTRWTDPAASRSA